MCEKTIRKKAAEQGYRLQRYKGYILLIDVSFNGIIKWCVSLEDVAETLDIK